MIRLPRLALVTPPDGPDPAPASLALLAGLAARRWRVQHFRARARLTGAESVGQVTGLPCRHLDAWLMPPEVLRGVFARGARTADLAIVEGTLGEADPAPGHCPCAHPGPVGPIAEALDLPRLAVLDGSGLQPLHLPHIPFEFDAVLLDGLESSAAFEPLRRMVGLILKKPVLGAVEALPEVRAYLAAAPYDQTVPPELIDRLAASFLKFADLDGLAALAESRPFPDCGMRSTEFGMEDGLGIPHSGLCMPHAKVRVAYAQDDAFGGYFPDTLETLETLGADLVEFSPIRDEALPEAVDLVMIGCGYPERFAEVLAGNLSLIAALRSHVCRGRRIYSEGGGTAYLGRSLILGDRRFPGAGILPFDAELQARPTAPRPVSRTLLRDGWLGPRGTVVRGYRSGRWRLLPAPEPDDCPARSGPLTTPHDMYFHYHAVGSLIHLHLAALPEVVAAFAGPPRATALPRRSRL